MATWSGWDTDFLAAASLPNTAANRRFMDDWANNATAPGCANNPIDLTHKETGSKNCHATGQTGVSIQRYTNHTWARTAFNTEIHSGKYAHLLAALKSGNPYTVKDAGAVASDLGSWTSVKFGNTYLAETQTGGTSASFAPHATRGWADLQRSINRGGPTALRKISGFSRATSTTLARRRRVKH